VRLNCRTCGASYVLLWNAMAAMGMAMRCNLTPWICEMGKGRVALR
jgi:hypothetical protein